MRFPLSLIAALALATPGLAQQPQQPPSGQSTVQGCNPSGRAEAATPPQRGSGDGTAPGNAGTTGWTGGMGGSHLGTNTQGATQNSPTWQPPTARGIDPIAAPARPEAAC
ncbi:MAG: hypothetical protein JWR00_557 [Rubritepida sp.]|nr:hypothetical protein [Rubritepida sp.]